MKNLLIIEADQNDADYAINTEYIDDETIDLVKRFAIQIKEKSKNQNHNWSTGGCLREDLGEKSPYDLYKDIFTEGEIGRFNELVPFGEYGIHTIEYIKILKVVEEEVLL